MGPQLRKTKAKTKIKLKGSNLLHSEIELSGLASEKVFKAAFDNAVDAIFWADTKTGKIVNCNYAAERLLERKKKEIVGSHQAMLHPPQKREHYQSMFKKHIKNKKVFDDEAEVITKSGKIKPVRITATVIAFDDRSVIQGIFRDITEQRRIREELAKSEEKYRALLENAPIGIYYNDFNGKFIYGNKMAEKIIGYKSEELVDKSFLKLRLLNSKDLARAAKILALNRIDKGTGPDEFTLTKKDKSKSSVNITTRPVTIGDTRLVLGMVEDITERKQAEEALRQSEEKLRSLVESAPSFIMIINKRGIIQFINRTAPGLAREDAIGRPIYDFIEPKHHAVVRKTINHIFKTGQASSYEIQGMGPRGHISWYVTNLGPIMHRGKVVAVTQIAADITDRKEAEKALRESEEMYRKLVEASPDGIVVLDLGGRVIAASQRMFELTGYDKAEEVIGKDCWDFIVPSEISKAKEQFGRVQREGMVRNIEQILLRKDGSQLVAELNGALLRDAYGNPKSIIITARDITERKKIEQMKESLVRDVSHSLKTPVAMLEMAHDMCGRAIKEGNIERVHRAYRITEANIARLRKDINNILELYVLILTKAGGAKLRRYSSLKKIIKEIIATTKHLMEEKKLSIKLDIAAGTDKISIIERELYTLLSNVIDNAIKFTDKGGILISATPKGKYTQIKVKDTGCGMTPAEKSMVFERFYKRSAAALGLGLGLTISKDIVERFGGKIGVISKGLGTGTTVIIDLPRK